MAIEEVWSAAQVFSAINVTAMAMLAMRGAGGQLGALLGADCRR